MKKEFRKAMLARRKSLTSDQCEVKSQKIIEKLIQTDMYKNAKELLIYCDYNNEVYTQSLYDIASLQGKIIYMPRVISDGKMIFYKVDNIANLKSGYMGIKEPDENICGEYSFSDKKCMLVCPGVAFDELGYRLGYGGGYYDRFIELCMSHNMNLHIVALAYECQIVKKLECIEAFDKRMDAIITEERII